VSKNTILDLPTVSIMMILA